MSFKDCIDFANETRTCYLATVEGDQPRVRALGMWFADSTGFYFQTETPKALYKQLQKNNKVEFYFHGKNEKVLRITGKTKFITAPEMLSKILEDRPFLKKFIKGPDDPMLVLFQVYTGEAYFWTMANNMKESQIPRIKF